MRLIIDGYNVIHAVPALARKLDQSLEAARQALLNDCQTYRAAHPQVRSLSVVFDGTDDVRDARARGLAGGTVMFTARGEEADDRILELLRTHRGTELCVVVSNDTYVTNNARAHGARVLSVAEFYARRTPTSPRAPTRSSGGVKTTISAKDAQAITDAYRKHLER